MRPCFYKCRLLFLLNLEMLSKKGVISIGLNTKGDGVFFDIRKSAISDLRQIRATLHTRRGFTAAL